MNTRVTNHSIPDSSHGSNHGLKKNVLGVFGIAFFIIAATSPLTAIVATTSIMISIGNGIGSPGAFLIATAVLLIFAVGYLNMTRHVKSAGALYSYVTLGLGRPIGLGIASITIFAYTTIQVGLYGGFGFYGEQLISGSLGIDIPWWVLASGAAVLCLLLGIRGVHSGSKLLGVLLTLEILLIVVLNGGIALNSHTHFSDFSLQPFSFHSMFSHGLGIALMFACAGFIGFEGSAIYSEEACNPAKTIPRATYLSVIFVGLLCAFTLWMIINALGVNNAVETSQKEGGNLVFWVANEVLGTRISKLFNIFIVTAMFAALVTFHNNISRYLYTLGRQGLVWSPLSYTHREKKTPYIASIVQTLSIIIICSPFVFLHLNPFDTLFTWMTGIGSVAIIFAQLVAAIAIFFFFLKNKDDKRIWHTIIAPIIAIIGLSIFFYYAITSIDLLMGVSSDTANWLAVGILAIFTLGIAYGFKIKITNPSRYNSLLKDISYEK